MIQQDAITIKIKKDAINPRYRTLDFIRKAVFVKINIDFLFTDAGRNYRGFIVMIVK